MTAFRNFPQKLHIIGLHINQGGNFGSAKSEKSDRRRQIFRSAGIRSAEPSNFVGKIGESAKSGDRQNRQSAEIGRSAKSADRQKSAKTPKGFT